LEKDGDVGWETEGGAVKEGSPFNFSNFTNFSGMLEYVLEKLESHKVKKWTRMGTGVGSFHKAFLSGVEEGVIKNPSLVSCLGVKLVLSARLKSHPICKQLISL
jgi:hypothetical protein